MTTLKMKENKSVNGCYCFKHIWWLLL